MICFMITTIYCISYIDDNMAVVLWKSNFNLKIIAMANILSVKAGDFHGNLI